MVGLISQKIQVKQVHSIPLTSGYCGQHFASSEFNSNMVKTIIL
jgi:hypothetical protein